MDWLLVLGGFVALLVGGEVLVSGAVGVARRLGVSPMVIGLTLVGFGTSTPELITSVHATSVGAPGIAVGNVVGSNIANILLILGLTALIRPVAANAAAFRRDGTALVLASALCTLGVLAGGIGPLAGLGLVAALVLYVIATWVADRRANDAGSALHSAEADAMPVTPRRLLPALAFFAGGLLVTLIGARLLVAGALALARDFGVPESVIGLTIVAVGTSLPELVTSTMAAVRGQSDVAFGNIVGSNIFNILGILGITAMLQPIVVPPDIADADIWVMVAATLALIATVLTGWRISRREGAVLLAAYAAYLVFLL